MAMSTLGYALLALLAKQPNTAYELSQRTRRPLSYFWTARYGQIHSQLRELTAAGLVSGESAPGPGPHDKRVYSITDAGRAALADWVVQPPLAEPSRDELLLKAYAMWTADPDQMRALVLAQAEMHRGRLATYQDIHDRVTTEHGSRRIPVSHPDFGTLATLRYGIGYERHRIEWCEWLAAELS